MSVFQLGNDFDLDKTNGSGMSKKVENNGNPKPEIGSQIPQTVYVSAQDKEEVESWVNSTASGRNNISPKVVVTQWLYKKGVTCSLCPKELTTVSRFVNHLEHDHKITGFKIDSEREEKPRQNTVPENFSPPVTGTSHSAKLSEKSYCLYQEEEYLQNQSEDVVCPLAKCGETFPSISSVNKHLKRDHKSIFSFTFDGKDKNSKDEMEEEKPPKKLIKLKTISESDTNSSWGIPPHENARSLAKVCPQCGSGFKNKSLLQQHIRRKICDLKLEQNKAIKAFAEWDVGVGGKQMYECPICLYKNVERRNFGRHVFFNHPDTVMEQKIKAAKIECLLAFERNKRKCSECLAIFNRPVLLQSHLQKTHKINVTLSAVVAGEKYFVTQREILTNIEKGEEEAFLPNSETAGLSLKNCIPEILPDIEMEDIPQESVLPKTPPTHNAHTHENNDDINLPSVHLDEENLNFFDCGANEVGFTFDSTSAEDVSGNNLSGDTRSLEGGNKILSKENFSPNQVEEFKENEDIPQNNENGDFESNHNAESVLLTTAEGIQNSLDDSDVEHPPPGFDEEELLQQKVVSTFPNNAMKKRKTATDYSFIHPFKLGSGSKFQCPYCSKTVVENIHFCRHLLVSHPRTELADEVSAKRIKWLLGIERKKYKCNICGSVAACAAYLKIHFKRVHNRTLSIDEVIGTMDLLDPEELEVFKKRSDPINRVASHQEGFSLLVDETAVAEGKLRALECDSSIALINDEQSRKNCLPSEDKSVGETSSVPCLPQGLETEDSESFLQEKIYGDEEFTSTCKSNQSVASLSLPKTFKKSSAPKSSRKKTGATKRKAIELSESVNCTEYSNCPFCGKDKKSFLNFKKHIAWHKKMEERNVSRMEGKVCPICKEILPPERNLNLHIFWHKRNGDVACDSKLRKECKIANA